MTKEPASLVIRAVEPSDHADVWEIWVCPEVVRGTLRLPDMSRSEAETKIANPPEGFGGIVAELDGKVVGLSGLHRHRGRRSHAASIGLMVHDNYTGQGIGSALLKASIDLAEKWYGLSRLELEVFTDNPAAIHLYEKHGFAIEGTLRGYALRDGEYVDVHAMARLKTQ